MRRAAGVIILVLGGGSLFAQQPTAPPPADSFPIETEISCGVASEQPPSDFHVPLTPAQEKRALAIYRKSIIITTHDHCFHVDDFRDAGRAGITARTIKPVVDGHYRRGGSRFPIESPVAGWQQRGKAAMAVMHRLSKESGGRMRIIRSAADIARVKRDGKQGIIISFEGGRPLAGRLENLKLFHALGLRELQLYWAVPSPLKNPDSTLTARGKSRQECDHEAKNIL